ncbi:MAG TPA: hypothetical protein VGN32_15150 [Ktedonobacterales bacterium]|nr:hypothetical protein [Ktedonobacterales bacterium]
MTTTQHSATPACSPFAPLLPLASRHLLDGDQETRLRAHAAVCDHCQAELALYERLDRGMRQLDSARQQALPPLTVEQIARTLATGRASGAAPRAPSPDVVPAPPRIRARRGLLSSLAPYAAVAVLLVLALVIFGLPGVLRGSRSGGGGGIPLAKDVQLTGIAMLPSGTGWAIGSDASRHGALFQRVAGRWRAVSLPRGVPAPVSLNSIALSSATEGWIVGESLAGAGANTSVLLHERAGAWSVVSLTFPAALTRVVMRTASDGWAVGTARDQEGVLLHYDGLTWTRVHDVAFVGVQLNGVSAIAPNNVWVTGRLADLSSVILHNDGSGWRQDGGLDLSEAALASIQMLSASEGWAVGGYCTCGHSRDVPTSTLSGALILYYHAGVWAFQTAALQASTSPEPFLGGDLLAVSMISPTEGWAVGVGSTIVHYSLGSWSPEASPSRLPPGATQPSPSLLGIAMVSATQGWVVGDQGTLLRFDNGDWEAD